MTYEKQDKKPLNPEDPLIVYETSLDSRLFLGTGRYPSLEVMREAIIQSGAKVFTVSLRRENALMGSYSHFWDFIKDLPGHLLPNTAGCRTVKEAVTTAHMARDLFNTNWIKLEVIGDDFTLQPDPFGTLEAARILCHEGFQVFPYTTEDLILGQKLLDAGCRVLMPWASPIGTGRGLTNYYGLMAMRQKFPQIPLIIDAGIGRPSHGVLAMEMGFDGVLLNTAVAQAADPILMAIAFSLGLSAGRKAYRAGLMEHRLGAVPSTPEIGLPYLA